MRVTLRGVVVPPIPVVYLYYKPGGDRPPGPITKEPPMTAKPATPAAAPATKAPAPKPCLCGCGIPTIRPDARYRSGHDARHAGEVGRSDLSEAKVRELFAGAPKLLAKALAVRETAARKVAEKEAKRAAQAAAKEAAKKVLASAGF